MSFAIGKGTPKPDPYRYLLGLDNQIKINARQDLSYHNLPVSKINNSLQNSTFFLNRELNRLPSTSTELKFEVTVNFTGL